jgi:hypothetical protein
MTQEIVLPTAPIKSSLVNPRVTLFYSAPKVGKTTAGVGIGKELGETYCVLDTEGSTDYIDAVKIRTKSAGQFLKACDAIIAADRPYKYVIVDTISGLDTFVQPLACVLYRKTPMGKNWKGKDILTLPHGGGWHYYRKAFFIMLDKAKECRPEGGSLILIAHLRDKIVRKGDEDVQALDIDLTGKIREIVCRDCDAIGYFYRKGDEGRLNFITTDTDNCGTRCAHLDGKDILLSKKVNGSIETNWKEVYIDR